MHREEELIVPTRPGHRAGATLEGEGIMQVAVAELTGGHKLGSFKASTNNEGSAPAFGREER